MTDDLRERLASSILISTVFVFSNETFASFSPSLQARMRQRKGCARGKVNFFHILQISQTKFEDCYRKFFCRINKRTYIRWHAMLIIHEGK